MPMPVLTMSESTERPPAGRDGISVFVDRVSLAFGGHRVLEDVSFRLDPGEVVVIRGENGSGKTTLLNVLSGYLKPDAGRVIYRLDGDAVSAAKSSPEQLAERGIGRTWQDIRLFPTMSVLDNVLAADSWERDSLVGGTRPPGQPTASRHPSNAGWLAPIAGVGLIGAAATAIKLVAPLTIAVGITKLMRVQAKRKDVIARAEWTLRLMGMNDRRHSSCDKLSVGQMKRVALARVLQRDPDILLLDEPLAGLDVESVQVVTAALHELAAVQGKIVLAIEHRFESMNGIANRVLFLNRGRLESE
jgi:branched-chain amino acid transport system ATP-binding protein